jgi:hypothetical protein
MQQVVGVLADQSRDGAGQELFAAPVDSDDQALRVRQVSTRAEGVEGLGDRRLRTIWACHGVPPVTGENTLGHPCSPSGFPWRHR